MLLWIILTAMTAGTAVWLSLPLLRQRDERSLAAAHELEVYRDQLAEVERELAEGAIEGGRGGDRHPINVARRGRRASQASCWWVRTVMARNSVRGTTAETTGAVSGAPSHRRNVISRA